MKMVCIKCITFTFSKLCQDNDTRKWIRLKDGRIKKNTEKIDTQQIVKLKLINVQGVTKANLLELEHSITKNTILCTTETQQKLWTWYK